MRRAHSREPKGIASSLVGVFPLVGAIASLVYVSFANGALASRGRLAFGDWIVGCASHPIGAIVLVQALYTALQAVLWLRYRPFPRTPGMNWPRVSVVIPAFNEGPMVERSIRSVARCDYDKDKLEIIVVDDGSRDDTFFCMQRLRREAPELVKLVRFVGNRGKRAALEAGFRAATGDVLVTIDSDSEIDPDTIHEMIAPLVVDPNIGAVAGRIAVLNRDSIIARMLEVHYALCFDFGRAAQAAYRCVSCCPGALSALRRRLVVPYLDEWTNQKFLGRPVNHGEDQALTNIVLRQGYDTFYQSTAVAHTLVPTTYRQLTRMFVRWDRSYIVEGFSFAKFMFSRYRAKNRLMPVVSFAVSNLRLLLFFVGLVELPGVFGADLPALAKATLALLLGAFFTALYYLRIERSARFVYGVLYAVFSLLCLQWTLPWALLTVRDERWGTR
ncbi:MAG: glycosyltransferase family 2 protein [Polyangiaceae bacterium]